MVMLEHGGGTGNAASIFLRPRTGRTDTDRDSEEWGDAMNRKASSASAYLYEKFWTRHWIDGDSDSEGDDGVEEEWMLEYPK